MSTDRGHGTDLPPPIALQLWTLRHRAAVDLEGVLRRVAGMGFVGVEFAGLHGNPAPRVRTLLDDVGLAVSGAHVRLPVGADTDAVLDEQSALGNRVLIGNGDDFDSVDAVARLADRLNEAAANAAARDMTVGYHNHHAEFSSRIDGRIAYDVLLERLDPRVVLEVDIYWLTVGGADPAPVIAALGERVRFLHVKDGPVEPPEPMTAVGSGGVDVVGALTANPAVEWHIVELDSCATDMEAAVEESHRFLVERGLSRGRGR